MPVKKDTCVEIKENRDNEPNVKYRGLIQKLTTTLSVTFLSLGWG